MEVITSVVVGMMIATAIGSGLRAALLTKGNVDDGSDAMIQARDTMDIIESLLSRAVYRDNNSRGLMGTPDPQRGFWFEADVDDDATLEWVWIWRDSSVPLTQDYWPYQRRYPIKVAIFTRRPPGGSENAHIDDVDQLYMMVNGDARCHTVIGAHATQFQCAWDPAPTTKPTRMRIDAGFHVHKDRATSGIFSMPWNSVAPGSTPYDRVIPTFTLTRFVTPRSFSTLTAPNGLAWSRSPFDNNATDLRDSEINYRAAIFNNPKMAWKVRPR